MPGARPLSSEHSPENRGLVRFQAKIRLRTGGSSARGLPDLSPLLPLSSEFVEFPHECVSYKPHTSGHTLP